MIRLKEKGNLSVSVIGGGKISEQHLKALNSINGISVDAICDLSHALASFTAKRFEVSRFYTDYKLMLDELDFDIVHVLTPPQTHYQIVKDCLDAGCFVIVEKPIALSNKNFNELHEYALSKGLQIIENQNYRFNEPIRQLEKIIENGRIGTVKEIEVRMSLNIREGGRYSDKNLPHSSHNLPAGVIHEFISHLVYLLIHFLPDNSVKDLNVIQANWNNHGKDDLFTYDDLDAFLLYEDIHCRLRFTSQHWPDSFSVHLRGTSGTAYSEIFNPLCLLTEKLPGSQHLIPLKNALRNAKTLRHSGFRSIWNKIRNHGAYDGLGEFINLTYQALLSDSELPVTYQQMNETSLLIDSLLIRDTDI